MEQCLYRQIPKNDTSGQTSEASPLKLPSNVCHECQALKQKGAVDTTCYNLDLNEKNCNISSVASIP
jgi:hypothetical protein